MPVILLIRHGENDYVKEGRLAGRMLGVHLNKQGREQARIVAKKLEKEPIKAIYSSPLERCLETAQSIAKSVRLELITLPGLNEVDYGDWQDKKLKKLSGLKLWDTVQRAPSRMRFPNGESFAEAQVRVCCTLDSLVKEHDSNDLIVCVSHSDLIKLAVAYYIGLPLDFFQRLHISPASVTVLYLGEQGSRLLTMNYESSFTLPKV